MFQLTQEVPVSDPDFFHSKVGEEEGEGGGGSFPAIQTLKLRGPHPPPYIKILTLQALKFSAFSPLP